MSSIEESSGSCSRTFWTCCLALEGMAIVRLYQAFEVGDGGPCPPYISPPLWSSQPRRALERISQVEFRLYLRRRNREMIAMVRGKRPVRDSRAKLKETTRIRATTAAFMA